MVSSRFNPNSQSFPQFEPVRSTAWSYRVIPHHTTGCFHRPATSGMKRDCHKLVNPAGSWSCLRLIGLYPNVLILKSITLTTIVVNTTIFRWFVPYHLGSLWLYLHFLGKYAHISLSVRLTYQPFKKRSHQENMEKMVYIATSNDSHNRYIAHITSLLFSKSINIYIYIHIYIYMCVYIIYTHTHVHIYIYIYIYIYISV